MFLEGIESRVSYDNFFRTLWSFLAKNSIIFDVGKFDKFGDIEVFSPRQVKLPFYVWDPENPTFSGIEMGFKCIQELQRTLPTSVNVFLALCMITSCGKLGVCIRHSALERISAIGTRRIITPLTDLRKKRWIAWGFTDEGLVQGKAKSSVPIKIIWLNRKRILI